MLQKFCKVFSSLLTIIFLLGSFAPVQAFYLEVPKRVREGFNNLTMSPKILGESISINNNTSQPTTSTTMPRDTKTCNINGVEKMGPCENSDTRSCNINGKEMPGPCENYNTGSGQSSQSQYYDERNDEERQRQDEERQKKDEERQRKDQERWINDMKRGMKDMEKNLTRLFNMFNKAEKEGTAIPQDIKDKFKEANAIIKQIKEAQTPEAMQEIDMQGLGDLMRELEEAREVLIDQAQRLKDMKRELKNLTKELGKFEKQVEKLKKQKMTIPEALPEALNKVKAAITAIQNAKTWEEAEAAGIEDMRELWETLDENRQKLEMLSRWPQTLKEVDRQLKQFDKELQRAKKVVDRAKKKEMDLSELYADFEEAVNKLKAAKEVALKKMAEGDGEGAFEVIENDIFLQMEDTWEHQRIIFTLSDLGRFKSDFKRGLNESYRLMMQLKRQKIDVTELEKLIIYATARGKEIEDLLKTKPIDVDRIIDLLQELEDLRQEFFGKADELSGKEELMPWEKGPILFKTPELPDTIKKIAPQKAQPVEEKKTEEPATIQQPSGNEPG